MGLLELKLTLTPQTLPDGPLPLDAVLAIGDRWALLILRELYFGNRRFDGAVGRIVECKQPRQMRKEFRIARTQPPDDGSGRHGTALAMASSTGCRLSRLSFSEA